ncbi:uncharacterized protein LOC125964388 [Orcinus orca]|uniref:uncharacterized protein LOC125964388 n=1 Tax=Orcinus orca TaxID=9733 RepID=UPI0021125EFD|nr:uncharacterized protein LOC125964388 [Orcinus orca]
MGIPLYVICCFSLAAFNMLSLNLSFVSLINMCLGGFFLGFILFGTLCASWTWVTLSFPMLGMFSTIISSNIFSVPFFFSSSSGTPIIRMLVRLVLSQRSLRLSSVLFIAFSLFCSAVVISTILSSRSLIRSSASVILLLIPSRVFLISFIVLFIVVCFIFSSSRSLLNVSCILSVLFPRFWIIFTIVILNCFSGRMPICSSFVRSGGFLSCSFICCVFFCLLILLILLCLGSPFCRLQARSSRCFWCLSPVAKVGSVGCVGFLVHGTSACVLVDEAGSCLSGGQVHVWWCVLRCLWTYDFRQPLC